MKNFIPHLTEMLILGNGTVVLYARLSRQEVHDSCRSGILLDKLWFLCLKHIG